MTNLNIPFRPDNSPEEDSIVIEKPDTIEKNITELFEKKSELNISVIRENGSSQYQSKICQLDCKQKKIILYKLNPQFNNSETMVRITAALPSGLVVFSSIISPEDGEENSTDPMYYQVSIPKKIYKKQQRNFFRVSLVPYNASMKYSIVSDSQALFLSGNCLDISLGGICGIFEDNEIVKATSDYEIITAESLITIPDLLDIKVPCIIRRLNRNPQSKYIAGIQFNNITDQQADEIEKAITYIERQHIRHFKK